MGESVMSNFLKQGYEPTVSSYEYPVRHFDHEQNESFHHALKDAVKHCARVHAHIEAPLHIRAVILAYLYTKKGSLI